MVCAVCMKIMTIPADVMRAEGKKDAKNVQKIVVTDVMKAGERKDAKRDVKRDVMTVADGIPMTVTHRDREPLPGRYEKSPQNLRTFYCGTPPGAHLVGHNFFPKAIV